MTSMQNQSDRVEPGGRVETSGEDIREQLSVIGEDVRTLSRQVKELTGQHLRSMGERAKELGNDFGDRVRQNPIRSVCIAAGVGALAGILLWRR